jgi:hypothetical protein
MKSWIILILFVLALINIMGCVGAKRDYDHYIAYENGLGGASEGFLRGFVHGVTGDTSDPTQPMAAHEQELARAKSSKFNWACAWTGVAVITALASGSKK